MGVFEVYQKKERESSFELPSYKVFAGPVYDLIYLFSYLRTQSLYPSLWDTGEPPSSPCQTSSNGSYGVSISPIIYSPHYSLFQRITMVGPIKSVIVGL